MPLNALFGDTFPAFLWHDTGSHGIALFCSFWSQEDRSIQQDTSLLVPYCLLIITSPGAMEQRAPSPML